MFVSTTTISALGVGPWIKLHWERPTFVDGSSVSIALKYIVTKECEDGSKCVVYEGTDNSTYPDILNPETRYYFSVVAVLPNNFKSSPKVLVYSSGITVQTRIENVTANSCKISCELKNEGVTNNIQYKTDIFSADEEWKHVHCGTKSSWELTKLPPHSVIIIRIAVKAPRYKMAVDNETGWVTVFQDKFITGSYLVSVRAI